MTSRIVRAHSGACYGRQSRLVRASAALRVSKHMHRVCPKLYIDIVLRDMYVAGVSYTRINIIRDALTRLIGA